jgi:hypothetical protein
MIHLHVRANGAFMSMPLVNGERGRMNAKVLEEIESLRGMTVGRLLERYRELFAEESRSNHKQFLFRRIAWRLQANAEGDLSERARKRALEITDDADLRIRAPKSFVSTVSSFAAEGIRRSSLGHGRDPRLPPPGTLLKRDFNGKRIVVRVCTDAFEWQDKRYRSLSAIAHEVTGTRWNGFVFFGLTAAGGERAR